MAKKKTRRSRGKAWHWRQTDCWYYTPPGSKKRVCLHDDNGLPVRGAANRQHADLALARVKASGDWRPDVEQASGEQWVVAEVCSRFIGYCQQRAVASSISQEYCDEVERYLNDLCSYCGALPVTELKKGHIEHWVESRPAWRSSATQRNAITIVLAAFNHATEMFDIASPLRGIKKPPQCPRLHSFTPEEEQLIYTATDQAFGDFLFAAVHTGLRPYCELAKLTPADVIESSRGMMWRVYASKTKKTRRIPVQRCVADLTRQLIADAPEGATTTIFRNSSGRPWKKGTGVGRFLKIKRSLGWDAGDSRQKYSTYTCRHTFAHRMLAGYWNEGAGCSIEVLAELLGDTPKVAFDHYGREWGQHYQDPLWEAIGVKK